MKRLSAGFLLLFCNALLAQPQHLYQQAVEILGGNGNVVSRWDEPVRFTVIDGGRETPALAIMREAIGIAGLELRVPHNETTSVSAYLDLLASTPPYALGAPCEDSANAPCFNFVVVLATNAQMLDLADAVPLPGEYARMLRASEALHCFFAPFRNGRAQIRQVVIYIRQDLDEDMLRTCLQEEIYQSFGMFGDYTGSTLFSFNNNVAPKSLTRYDRALLASLYAPQIKPGYPVHAVATLFVKRVEAGEFPD